MTELAAFDRVSAEADVAAFSGSRATLAAAEAEALASTTTPSCRR